MSVAVGKKEPVGIKKARGLTLIELMVTVAVVIILAAITIISYRNLTTRADNAARLVELRAWEVVLRTHEAREKNLIGQEETEEANHCLGTGFPVGYDGYRRCREPFNTNSLVSYKESDSAALMTSLSALGQVEPSGRKPVNGWLVGPWLEIRPQWKQHRLSTAIKSRNPEDCTSAGFLSTWIADGGNSDTQICTVEIRYN